MNKLSMIVLAQLVGTVAMAQTSLTVTTNNGTVAPQYQVRTSCTISEDGIVSTVGTGVLNGGHPTRQATFTHDVPAPAVMVQLAKLALTAKEASTGARAPIGGGMSRYSVNVGPKSNEIRTTAGATVILDTANDSAKKLADFMAVNCK